MWLWNEIYFTRVLDHLESNVGVPVFDLVSGNHEGRNNRYIKIPFLYVPNRIFVMLFFLTVCKFLLRLSASNISHKNDC